MGRGVNTIVRNHIPATKCIVPTCDYVTISGFFKDCGARENLKLKMVSDEQPNAINNSHDWGWLIPETW
jgi:hypothetical protein